MKLHVLSDLHLGHRQGQFVPDFPEHDVLVCVGDVLDSITDGIEVLGRVSERPVVFVAGNHEFYGFEGASLDEAFAEGRKRAAEFSHVHLLENEAVVLDGLKFLGTTLWTDYALYGEESCETAMDVARRGLNDHHMIALKTNYEPSRAFLPSDALNLHHKARLWLTEAFAEPFDGPTVVCTHHAPHRRSVAPQFEGDLMSAAFVSHIPELVEGENAPDHWIHGHTHAAMDYRAERCRVICNPLGYPHEETGVDPDMVVEV